MSYNINFLNSETVTNQQATLEKVEWFSQQAEEPIEFRLFENSVTTLTANTDKNSCYKPDFSDESSLKTITIVHWLGVPFLRPKSTTPPLSIDAPPFLPKETTPPLLKYLPANWFKWPAITDFC